MKKRILSLILALIICLSLATAAMAEGSNFSITAADGSRQSYALDADASGSGWSWSAADRRLSLSGFKGESISFNVYSGDVEVFLAAGSANSCHDISCWKPDGSLWSQPTLSFTGTGSLSSTLIQSRCIEIDGPAIHTETGIVGLIMRSGSLSAAFIESDLSTSNEYHGGSISLDCEAGMAFSIWWPLEGGEIPLGYDSVTATDENGKALVYHTITDEYDSTYYTFSADYNTPARHVRIAGGAPQLPAEPSPSFPDVKEGEWWYDNIDAAAKAGLVAGNADGSFDPKGELTWAQTLVFATRLNQYSKGEDIYGAEDQVGKWYQIYLDYCLDRNILRVTPEDMGASISRADAAVIFSRVLFAAPQINTVPSDHYSDLRPGDEAYKAVMELTEAGITNGMGDGSFGVDGVFTRAQVAAIVARIAGLVDPVHIN